jgi:hypothetical protein
MQYGGPVAGSRHGGRDGMLSTNWHSNSTLLIAVQPPICTIPCNSLYLLANPMLPLSMFFHPEPRRASQSGKSSFPPPVFPFLCSLSPLRCRCEASAPRLFPRFCSGGSSNPCFSSSLHPTPHIPNSFTIRTSAKRACNPCRMRSFKTLDLKSFRMCSSEKKGRGPVAQTSVCALTSFAARVSATRRNPCHPFRFMGLLHDLRIPQVWVASAILLCATSAHSASPRYPFPSWFSTFNCLPCLP